MKKPPFFGGLVFIQQTLLLVSAFLEKSMNFDY